MQLKYQSRRWLSLLLAAGMMLCLCACGANRQETKPAQLSTTAPLNDNQTMPQPETTEDEDAGDLLIDTYIMLNDDMTTINGEGAVFQNGRLTVSKPGTYSFKGTLKDGQIYVDTSDENEKVRLYLDGVDIYCSFDAPIYIAESPKETKLILAAGSENVVKDNGERTMTEAQKEDNDFATAAVYSKDDLEVEGEGSLTIDAAFCKGIFSRDDLQVSGGAITVTAADDGIRGKDSVEISGGTLNVTSGGDGIRTSNEEKGDIAVSGGDITVKSAQDAIQAVGSVAVSGGTFKLQSGGGCVDTAKDGAAPKGVFASFAKRASAENNTQETAVSMKGVKADGAIAVSGGSFHLDCLDDALHAGTDLAVAGGNFQIKTGDDGIHADGSVVISGGDIVVEQSYEGVEGNEITVIGGNLDVTASDDGFNAAAPNDQNDLEIVFDPAQIKQNDNTQQPNGAAGDMSDAPPDESGFSFRRKGPNDSGPRGGRDKKDDSCSITLQGGVIKLNTGGDGLDSNGSITMTGGTVTVFGPTDNGNSALDYAGSFTVDGGKLLAIGSGGMAQGVSDGSAGAIALQQSLASGDKLQIKDGESVLFSVTLEKEAGHFVAVGEALQKRHSYTVEVNGTAIATEIAK